MPPAFQDSGKGINKMGNDNYALVFVGKKITEFKGQTLSESLYYRDRSLFHELEEYYLEFINRHRTEPQEYFFPSKDRELTMVYWTGYHGEFLLGFSLVHTPWDITTTTEVFKEELDKATEKFKKIFNEEPKLFIAQVYYG
jgi:hypothetical protein